MAQADPAAMGHGFLGSPSTHQSNPSPSSWGHWEHGCPGTHSTEGPDRCQGYLDGGARAPRCHPHVGDGTEQLKQRRGAEPGSGVIPAPHRPLPNLGTARSRRPGHATLGMNIGLGHPRGHPDGTCHLHRPRAGSAQGCGWAPRPLHPGQGTQWYLFPVGRVGATTAGWGAGGGGASPYGRRDASCCLRSWEGAWESIPQAGRG